MPVSGSLCKKFELGGKSTKYPHLVRCGKIYKSAVKLKEMALPQKNEGVASILR
jgi:hypothetical protein